MKDWKGGLKKIWDVQKPERLVARRCGVVGDLVKILFCSKEKTNQPKLCRRQ